MNISGGRFAVDLTKALSYLTGSHVPSGSTVNVVGLDYDSPQNANDSTTESMYLHYYPTSDRLVAAWRNAFAAHCNAREDLMVMGELGEFVVGWSTTSISHDGASLTGQAAPFANGAFEEEVFYNWAPLETAASRSYTVATGAGSRPAIIAESAYFCHNGMDEYDGVIVGSYADNRTYTSKFAISGTTNTAGSGPYTARIGIIDAYNKANPVDTDLPTDPFGFKPDNIKKYGYVKLNDIPMTLKIQTGMSTHFTLPVGGINVMCGLMRMTDTWNTDTPPDESGASSAASGTLTVWVNGWTEF